MARKPKFKSLREALLAEITEEPRAVKSVIEEALLAHPMKGKTPVATAHAQLVELVRRGIVHRPERGQVALGAAPAPAPSRRRRG